MKVAVIGGGSTYTPELVSGLTRLDVGEFVLEDIDPARREVVGGMARRMLARQGFEGRLEVTGDLDTAVDGADYVLIQIRVGGQAARLQDETRPLACGCIGQETTGAGGFAKAMRTVPVVLGIAERVAARAAPGAWIVDFTNPVGIVTRALLEMYRDPNLSGKPALVERRGGAYYSEAAVGLVRSLSMDDGAVHEVDMRNGGTLAGLADDDVVEVPARVGRDGLVALEQAPLAPELLGLVQ